MRLDKKKTIRRLLIYFFYDEEGVVDRYIPYMLNDIQKSCSEIIIVCNGKLTPASHDILMAITPNILVRENKGFDVWAYKAALDAYGWEALSEYDEIIMMNHTIMGPLYPLEEMFADMDKCDVDFWGINKYHKHDIPAFDISYGYIPEHIQSHFIAVRQTMIKSKEFQDYWDNRPMITCYQDAVGKHEAIFTKYFSDKGFRWTVYVNTDDMEGVITYPLFYNPVHVIRDKRCPIFKRRNFFHNYGEFLALSDGRQGKELLTYITNETNYDVNMIWENLLRTNHMKELKDNLNLNYILPARTPASIAKSKLVLVMYICNVSSIESCMRYADSMPEKCDLIITLAGMEAKELESKLNRERWNWIHIVQVKKGTADVSALLVTAAPYLRNYEYVCFVHDYEEKQDYWTISSHSASARRFENVLGTKEYVTNIISLFQNNPKLGLAFPPPANHGIALVNYCIPWGYYFEKTKKLAEELGVYVPMDAAKEAVAPIGRMFWCRAEALEKLFEKKWEYQDFSEGKRENDDTISNVIERVFPFVVQDAGYYTSWILSDDYAQTELTNLSYMMSTLAERNMVLFGYNSFSGLSTSMATAISTHHNYRGYSIRRMIKRITKKLMPQKLWDSMRRLYRRLGGKMWLEDTIGK